MVLPFTNMITKLYIWLQCHAKVPESWPASPCWNKWYHIGNNPSECDYMLVCLQGRQGMGFKCQYKWPGWSTCHMGLAGSSISYSRGSTDVHNSFSFVNLCKLLKIYPIFSLYLLHLSMHSNWLVLLFRHWKMQFKEWRLFKSPEYIQY